MAKPNPFKLITNEQTERTEESEPRDIHAYESEQRARIAAKDWAAIHVRGDKAGRIALPSNWGSPR